MAWQDEMVTVLRVLINDLTTTPTYSDDRMEQVICVCSQLVRNEMTFSQDFKADVSNVNITPDPTDASKGTRDDSYINLVCLRAACILERGEVRAAAGQAISIKDGSSAIDLREVAAARMKLLDKGYCAVYEDAKFEYMAGQVRVAGAAILSPFRIFAGYSDTGYYPSQYERAAYFR